MIYKLEHKDALCGARAGIVRTAHGTFTTPRFMPVGTRAAVKAIPNSVLESLGADIILGNTYHLMTRPGIEAMAQLGGLHKFMSWDRSILTDSGGFQVYSLASLRDISEEGVAFKSHIDGQKMFWVLRNQCRCSKSWDPTLPWRSTNARRLCRRERI